MSRESDGHEPEAIAVRQNVKGGSMGGAGFADAHWAREQGPPGG